MDTAISMTRDPFYNQIMKRLKEGPIDPSLFEACAADVLRDEWPALVPVPGGQDAGMDGAVGNIDGPAFPLVTTIGANVIGNLTKNLTAHKTRGGGGNRAILATTQALSQLRRSNNEKRANELGYTLVQQYDRQAIADRLYRNKRWLKDLLNLAGEPSTLSVLPKTTRPQSMISLIGRDEELQWLLKGKTDQLLVGQPGSGKTYLFREMTKAGKALFVINPAMAVLAQELRDAQAKVLIVDDAHVTLEFLSELCHFRAESGLDFRIIASCWPNHKSAVAAALQLGVAQISELELLNRDQVAAILKSINSKWTNTLVHELINQSEGKPGLAASLAHICQQGDYERAYYGLALADAVLRDFKFAGGEIQEVLATISLSGDAGLTLNNIARILKIPTVTVRRIVTELAQGGIIRDLPHNKISVRPPPLREVLVKDVFFGASKLDIAEAIEIVNNSRQTAIVLLGASVRGANVPQSLLIDLLEKAKSNESWEHFARLSEENAKYVLDRFPNDLEKFAKPLLHHCPKQTIREFLTRWRDKDSSSEKLLKFWVKDALPGASEAYGRREQLLSSIESYASEASDFETVFKALRIIFEPEFESHSSVPGSGRSFTFMHGNLGHADIQKLALLWPRALALIRSAREKNWVPIVEIAHEFVIARDANEQTFPIMHELAARMLTDLAPMIAGEPLVALECSHLAMSLKLILKLDVPEEFEILFPAPNYNDDWQATEKRQRDAISTLANEWRALGPERVAQRLDEILKSSSKFGSRTHINGPRMFAWILADTLDARLPWARAVSTGFPEELIYPFLLKSAEMNESGWQDLASSLLSDKRSAPAAVESILRFSSDNELLGSAISLLPNYPQLVEILVLRGQLNEPMMKQLLQHGEPAVREAVAIGLWREGKRESVPPAVFKEWSAAIVNLKNDRNHHLPGIFKVFPEVAAQWLEARIQNDEVGWSQNETSAAKMLTPEQRIDLIRTVSVENCSLRTVSILVGEDTSCYQALLTRDDLRRYHLGPLSIGSDYYEKPFENGDSWVAKVRLALAASHDEAAIVQAVFPTVWGNSGNESDYWVRWSAFLRPLVGDSNSHVKNIVAEILRRTDATIARAKKEERDDEVYGEF